MGSGYREFQASEVLTSSNVQNYLMDQAVMSFASSTARASAVTAPEVGMVSYIGSSAATEGIEAYNSAGDWTLPWNMPWGMIAQTVGTADTSTTTTTVTWLTVTFTAVSGRQYRIVGSGALQTNTDDQIGALLITDASNTQLARADVFTKSSVYSAHGFVEVFETGLSGSTERRLRVSRTSATGNQRGEASATQPAYLTVYDVGPSGAPT